MAVEYRLCPTCGNRLAIAGQRFCAACGTPVRAAEVPAPAPPAAPPVAAPVPPAAPAPAAPPPSAWSPPPASGDVPPAPQWGAPAQPGGSAPTPPPAGVGATGGLSARLPVSPLVAVAGVVVVVVAVIAAVVLVSGSGSSDRPGITYDPSSLSCTGESFTVTMRLPATVGAADDLAMLVDGQVFPAGTVWTPGQGGFVVQSNGTWLMRATQQTPAASECLLAPGTHTLEIVDASGATIAQGSLARQ